MDYNEIYEELQSLTQEELLDLEEVGKILGFNTKSLVDTLISPRGYRMLNKVPRIPAQVIENLVKEFKELKLVIEANYDELDKVEGIGEARSKAIKNGLRRIKEQVSLDKQL